MGADKKISINSQIFYNPKLISDCAKIYGSQINSMPSIDCKYNSDNRCYEVYVDGGKRLASNDIVSYLKKVEEIGAGEVLINSIDRDGSRLGYDLKLIENVKKNLTLPIIIAGGVGSWNDFLDKSKILMQLQQSNIFHFSENSYVQAIKYLTERNVTLDLQRTQIYQNPRFRLCTNIV